VSLGVGRYNWDRRNHPRVVSTHDTSITSWVDHQDQTLSDNWLVARYVQLSGHRDCTICPLRCINLTVRGLCAQISYIEDIYDCGTL